MADTGTVASLIACAEWAAFKCFGGLLREIFVLLPSANVDGLEVHTMLVQRLHFFNVVDVLGRLDYRDNKVFIELLCQMDELQKAYGPQLITKGISKLKWLDQRHAIIVEMGMALLRSKVEVEDAVIRIDPSFVFHDYRMLIKDMFKKHRKYSAENEDESCDVEDEDELIKQSIADLCDVLSRPQTNSKQKRSDPKLNDVKLRILLVKHTTADLELKINIFVKHIESMVLPTPVLTVVNEDMESVIEELREKDWTEKQARDSGPYAGLGVGRSSAGSLRSSGRGDSSTSHGSFVPPHRSEAQVDAQPVEDDNHTDDHDHNSNSNPPAPVRKGNMNHNQTRIRVLDTPTPSRSLARVGKEFNTKVNMKDPLPDILSEMIIEPVASRLTRKRPISNSPASNNHIVQSKTVKSQRKKQNAEKEDDHRNVDEEEDENERGRSDDEVLTEDQESMCRNDEIEDDTTESIRRKFEISKRASEPVWETNNRAINSPSTRRRQQLHELPHYMESQEITIRKKLTETRESAERVNFNDMEEQTGGERGEEDSVDEYDPDSDFNGNQNEENLGQQLRRKAIQVLPKRHQFPDKLARPRDSYGRNNRINKQEQGKRRKWTYDEETALDDAILKHGVGCWSEILADETYADIFQGRTNINLKDKHRNLSIKREQHEE